jgi:hypothetical protein
MALRLICFICPLNAEQFRGWSSIPDKEETLFFSRVVSIGPFDRPRDPLVLKLPAVYYRHRYALCRGRRPVILGYDILEHFRGGANYVDRILKGEKPADLPVQAPNRFELLVNLKTGNALGLTIPSSIVGPTDEVIE